MTRPAALQQFLDAAAAAVSNAATPGSPADQAAGRVFSRARSSPGSAGAARAERLPVCRHLDAALEGSKAKAVSAVAAALHQIEPALRWTRRSTADPNDAVFWNGHANAVILGPGGIEERSDLWIGASLMAPHVTYVDHDHPPEEVYLALTPGEWWSTDMDWTDPGAGGLIYHRPGIRHAMRSGTAPFLALWFLPI
jgi:hypothetical protein